MSHGGGFALLQIVHYCCEGTLLIFRELLVIVRCYSWLPGMKIQTVHADNNFKCHDFISKFKEKAGFLLVVNISLNIRGEPMKAKYF